MAHQQGQRKRAISLYEKTLALDPQLAGVPLQLAELYLEVGDYANARKLFTYLLEQDPTNLAVREGVAVCQLKEREFQEARDGFIHVLEREPRSPRSLNYLGVIADLEGRYGDAEHFYQRALAMRPDDPLILNNLGYSKMMTHQYGEAVRYFEKALTFDPENEKRIKNNLSISYAWQGNYQQALLTLSPTLEDPVAYNNVGYIALLRNDYRKAIELLEMAISLSPNYYRRAAVNLSKANRLLKGE